MQRVVTLGWTGYSVGADSRQGYMMHVGPAEAEKVTRKRFETSSGKPGMSVVLPQGEGRGGGGLVSNINTQTVRMQSREGEVFRIRVETKRKGKGSTADACVSPLSRLVLVLLLGVGERERGPRGEGCGPGNLQPGTPLSTGWVPGLAGPSCN